MLVVVVIVSGIWYLVSGIYLVLFDGHDGCGDRQWYWHLFVWTYLYVLDTLLAVKFGMSMVWCFTYQILALTAVIAR